MSIEKLTENGANGIRTFCMSCSDKPIFGKCDIGNECYHRQIYKALRDYEDTSMTSAEITSMQQKILALQKENSFLKKQIDSLSEDKMAMDIRRRYEC